MNKLNQIGIFSLGIIGLLSLGTLTRLIPAAKAQATSGCYMIDPTGKAMDLSNICGYSPVVELQAESQNLDRAENLESQSEQARTDSIIEQERISRGAALVEYNPDRSAMNPMIEQLRLNERTPGSLRRLRVGGLNRYQSRRVRKMVVREQSGTDGYESGVGENYLVESYGSANTMYDTNTGTTGQDLSE